MRRFAILFFLAVFALPVAAQRGPELDALADGFFANDLKTVLLHVPRELSVFLATASVDQQRRLAESLMLRQRLEQLGLTFKRSSSGPVLIVEPSLADQNAGFGREELYLDKRTGTGDKATLYFHMKTSLGEAFDGDAVGSVSMRFVDGQWRVYRIDAADTTIRLDDPKFLEEISR
jgi:hypothetical protein